MKKIIEKGPMFMYQVVAAIVLVALSYFLVSYFVKQTPKIDIVKEPVSRPEISEEKKQQFISPNELGIVHLELDSPSYAKSNFDINPDTSITVYYNIEVDSEEILDNFSLINKNSGEQNEVSVSSDLRGTEDDKDTYNWDWQKVWKQKLVFTPKKELEPVAMYEVSIQLDPQKVFSYEFLTADDPGVLSTNLENREFELKRGEEVKVVFRSPMDEKELNEKVKIYPSFIDFEIEVVDKIMTVSGGFSPRSYQLTIPAGTKDIYGRELGSEFIVSFDVN